MWRGIVVWVECHDLRLKQVFVHGVNILQESALKLRAYPVARTISDLKESEGCEEGEDECAKNLGLTTTEQPPVSMQQHTARTARTSDSSVARPRRGSITLADLPKFLSRRNTLTDLPKFHSRRNIEYGAMPSDSSDKKEGSPKGDRRGLGISISKASVRRTSATLRECVRRNSGTGMRPEASILSQSFTETPSEFANEEEGEPGSPDSETVESMIVSLDSEEGMPPSCSTAMRKSISSCRDSIDAELHRLSYNF